MNKIYQVKWSDVQSGWVVTSELSSRIPSRRRTARGRGLSRSWSAGLTALSFMVFQALAPSQAWAANLLQNVQVRKAGVSISQLQWVNVPLEVGQTLSAVYQFSAELNGVGVDQSRYLYGYRDTAEQVAVDGLAIEKSGEVPGRLLTEADIGKTLELSVLALSRQVTGNVLTINTRSLSEDGVVAAVPPRIADLHMQGRLEIGQDLTASYAFDANGGMGGDASTYAW
ncbi:ESPR-type extended signal peptide-containing protein, partial [Chromobacterium vaccinii]